MFGRMLSILGIKNEELGDALKRWKARCVFQGSHVRTKTGISAADLTGNEQRACIFCCAGRE